MSDRTCSVEGCERPRKSRGWCGTHHERWRTTGTLELRPGTRSHPGERIPAPIRFWRFVEKTETCWLWLGGNNGRYGVFSVVSRHILAHRFIYELIVAPIPPGLVIDHLCRTTMCVNPAHLEPVTQKENIRRGLRHAAT